MKPLQTQTGRPSAAPPPTKTHRRTAPTTRRSARALCLATLLALFLTPGAGCRGLSPPDQEAPGEADPIASRLGHPASAAIHFSEALLNSLTRQLVQHDETISELFIDIPDSLLNLDGYHRLQLPATRWSIPIERSRIQIPEDSSTINAVSTLDAERLEGNLEISVFTADDEAPAFNCTVEVLVPGATTITGDLVPDLSVGAGQVFQVVGDPVVEALEVLLITPGDDCPDARIMEEVESRLQLLLGHSVRQGTKKHIGRIGRSLSSTISLSPGLAGTVNAPAGGDNPISAQEAPLSAPSGTGTIPGAIPPGAPGVISTAHMGGLVIELWATRSFAQNPASSWVLNGGTGMVLDTAIGHMAAPVQVAQCLTPPRRHTAARATTPAFGARTPGGERYQIGLALGSPLVEDLIGQAMAAGFLCNPVRFTPDDNASLGGGGGGDNDDHEGQEAANHHPLPPGPLGNLARRGGFLDARIRSGEVAHIAVTEESLAPGDDAPLEPVLQVNVEGLTVDLLSHLEEIELRLGWAVADVSMQARLVMKPEDTMGLELTSLVLSNVQLKEVMVGGEQPEAGQGTRGDNGDQTEEWLPQMYRTIMERLVQASFSWPMPVIANHKFSLAEVHLEGDQILFYFKDP